MLLLGAMMTEIHEYSYIYYVDEDCNMAMFGRHCIPGFKMEQGHGYYRFSEPEFIKPQRNVILVDKARAESQHTDSNRQCHTVGNIIIYTERKVVHRSWCKVLLHWM